MIISFPKGPVLIDGVEKFKDFRINIEGHRFRMKFTGLANGTERPVDIVCYSAQVGIEALGVGISLEGIENVSQQAFQLKIIYDLRKKMWKVNGTVNACNINCTYGNFMEVMKLFANM